MNTSGRNTRERILAAAAELLLERDFRSVTTRAIAERAGVNNALVHYHFGSRMAVLVRAAGQMFAELLTEQARIVREAGSAPAGASEAVAWAVQLTQRAAPSRLYVEFLTEAVRDPAARAPVAEALRELRNDLAAAFGGLGLPDDQAWPAAVLLSALLDGVLLHRLIDPELSFARATEYLRAISGEDRR